MSGHVKRDGSTCPTLPLRRMHPLHTGPGRYQTLDGFFEIAQGANGAGPWMISAMGRGSHRDDLGIILLVSESTQSFRTLREAREWLAGSVYAKPHGWLHQSTSRIVEVYREMLRTPVAVR